MNKDAIIAEQAAKIAELSAKIANLEVNLGYFMRLFTGSKSERFVPKDILSEQLNLFNQGGEQAVEEPQEEAEECVKETITYERKKPTAKPHPGRNPIPNHFEVHTSILEPEEDITGLVKIGEEISEWVEYTPASLIKKRVIRPKYAKPTEAEGTKVLIRPLPSRPIEKSIAGASLLAFIFVAKYIDHLPFYRQIQRFKRDYDWLLHKSTINSWFIAICTLLEPLYDELVARTMDTDYLQADESKIKVLARHPREHKDEEQDKAGKKREKQRLGWMWVVHNPIDGYVLFNYEDSRSANAAEKTLAGFKKGALQTDGYSSYNRITALDDINRLGCLAHTRRKFFDARNSDPKRAEKALGFFKLIYKHDEKAMKLSEEERFNYRLEHMGPIYQRLKDWVDAEALIVTPKSPMGKAMTYLQNQWPNLRTLFQDGKFLIDNNLIENKIRPLALGRKNYLFAGSHEGAQRAAMMYSFFATCKAQGVNPQEWLTSTLEKIPDTKLSELHTLLPGYKLEQKN